MNDITLKKLGFIEAYEFLFGTDEHNVKSNVTEQSEEFGEWQEFKKENEDKIAEYKKQFIAHFYKVEKE